MTTALAILAVGCDAAADQAGPSASKAAQPGLSARAQCYVSALAAVEDPGTTCMADCIRSRSAWSPGTYPRPGSGIRPDPRHFATAIDTLTDAAGVFAFDSLSEAEFEIVIGAGAGYLSPPPETLVLRQGERCRLIARLQRYDYEGF